MKEKAIRWDGRSRIATEEYKKILMKSLKRKKMNQKKIKILKIRIQNDI